jgi:membrane protein DedA with SNARE-associated domain
LKNKKQGQKIWRKKWKRKRLFGKDLQRIQRNFNECGLLSNPSSEKNTNEKASL